MYIDPEIRTSKERWIPIGRNTDYLIGEGSTALHLAARKSDVMAVKVLLNPRLVISANTIWRYVCKHANDTAREPRACNLMIFWLGILHIKRTATKGAIS